MELDGKTVVCPECESGDCKIVWGFHGSYYDLECGSCGIMYTFDYKSGQCNVETESSELLRQCLPGRWPDIYAKVWFAGDARSRLLKEALEEWARARQTIADLRIELEQARASGKEEA